MEVIPAIDLRNGRCVRLFQGDFNQETVFSDDPLAVALSWQEQGAQRLHVVDLDGAIQGKPVHLDIISAIVRGWAFRSRWVAASGTCHPPISGLRPASTGW